MQYRSTRSDKEASVDSATAVLRGLAPDGGLYVPVEFPQPNFDLQTLAKMSYQQVAKLVLSWFFDDYTDQQLEDCVVNAYGSQFDDEKIVPISKKAGNYYMELFHGPTLAFKDIALQMLPQLMMTAAKIKQQKNKIIILTATSGDTGTASMRGFSDIDGTNVVVFYPNDGVSPVQLRQMLSQPGKNLAAFAVEGNFDQAQTKVKQIFNDVAFKKILQQKGYQFSSANSMNIGRLIPQVAYYFYTYGQLIATNQIKLNDQVNFSVPTGNFGDILAGYYAQKLGLPISKLICASNQNNVLTDFFATGKYNKNRQFHVTNSPSMDILVSSNLERLLFDVAGENHVIISDLMNQLEKTGEYEITPAMKKKLSQFSAGFADESQIQSEIKRVFDQDKYALDPHTAVGSYVNYTYRQQTNDQTPAVIVSTASPYKFPETVYHAITNQTVNQPGLPAIKQLNELLQDSLPAAIEELFNATAKSQQIISTEQMEDAILKQNN